MSAPTLVSSISIESTSLTPTVTKGQLMLVFFNLQNTNMVTIGDTLNNDWELLQYASFNSGAWQAFVWLATANATGHPAISISGAGGGGGADMIVNVYSPCVVDVFSPVASGKASGSSVAVGSAAISTNFAEELIVGWGGVVATANSPYTLDGKTGATLNGTESLAVSSQGSFQSNFNGTNPDAWATGVLSLVAIYAISGNAGAAGAVVSYSGPVSGNVTADGSGNYSIPGLPNGSYTITPSKPGFTFSPTSQNETVNGANITGVNFTVATRPPVGVGFSPSFVAQNEGGLRIYVSPGGINGFGANGQFVSVPANSLTYVWVSSNGIVAAGPNVPAGAYAIALVASGQVQTSGSGPNAPGAYVTSNGILNIADIRTNK
jgi:hypothetical protein